MRLGYFGAFSDGALYAVERAIAAVEKTDSALRLNVQFNVLSLDDV